MNEFLDFVDFLPKWSGGTWSLDWKIRCWNSGSQERWQVQSFSPRQEICENIQEDKYHGSHRPRWKSNRSWTQFWIVLKNPSSLLEVNALNKLLLLAHPKFRKIENQIEIWIQKLLALAVQQFLKEEIQVEISIQKFLLKEEIICDFQTILNKVGCILSMVICSEFRLGKYRDDDHREEAPHFIKMS